MGAELRGAKPLLQPAKQANSAVSAATTSLAPTAHIDLGDGITLEFVLIPAGSFVMGSPENAGSDDESPQHRVTITRPFYLGKYEVTQEQWQAVMGGNPSHFKGARLPVDTVSWRDCQRFLAKLKEKTGREFALPTEAQWEYACRAGTSSLWSFGDDESQVGTYAWFVGNAKGVTHPVETKKPNAWGLFDMHGNVGEWTADWYEKHAYSHGDVSDPRQPEAAGRSPVFRGGAWGDNPDLLRSAYRNTVGADNANWGVGLRVVMLVSGPSGAPPASLSQPASSTIDDRAPNGQ